MTDRYFSRALWRPAPFSADLQHLAYASHQAVWKLFAGQMDRRDFLFHPFRSDQAYGFYILSHVPPSQPDGWSVQTKDYAPEFSNGQRLMFRLRLNAVVSRSEAPGQRGTRHSIFTDARKNNKDSTDSPEEFRKAVVAEWLGQREDRLGFRTGSENLIVGPDERIETRKKSGSAPIVFHAAEVSGLLIVLEANTFLTTVLNGVGRAKSFGCGLMLLRPVP